MTKKIQNLKFKKICLAAFVLISMTSYAYAKDEIPSVHSDVDKRNATIGDHIIYSITVRVPKGVEVGFPSFSRENKVGAVEVKDHGVRSKKGFFGGKVLTAWYDLVAYDTGKIKIPELDVKYKKASEKDVKAVKTQAIEIAIHSVLPKNTAITDIKDIKGPLSYFEINWFLVLGILGLIGALILFIYFKKRMQRPPVKLPHETALEELEAIRAALLKTGDIKNFYVSISDCIRYYIERSFALKASEMTTEEFLNSLKTSPVLTPEQRDLLKIFLGACDLVKFAKYTPTAPEIEKVFASAQKFVEETSPKKEI